MEASMQTDESVLLFMVRGKGPPLWRGGAHALFRVVYRWQST